MTADRASFAHRGLAVSLLVPDDWEVEETSPAQVRFYGPAHPELDDYRPTWSIARGEPEGVGESWFEEFCTRARRQLETTYEGFTLLRTERYTLSSLVPVNATWYEWQPQPEARFAQLQALIPVDAYTMYLVNAATLADLADEQLPLFDEVLRSLRILPPG